jgi:hypothetical protein
LNLFKKETNTFAEIIEVESEYLKKIDPIDIDKHFLVPHDFHNSDSGVQVYANLVAEHLSSRNRVCPNYNK